MHNKLRFTAVVLACSCLISVVSTPAQASSHDSTGELPDPGKILSGEFEDQSGIPLRVLDRDTNSDGETRFKVKSASGLISTVNVQYSTVSEADQKQMLSDMNAPIPDTGYSTEAPPAETVHITPDFLPKDVTWTPISAVVASPNAVSVAWKNDDFVLEVAGNPAVKSAGGVATLIGLKENEAYEASITKMSELSEDIEFVEQRNFTFQTSSADGVVSAAAALPYTTAYVHKTFIPDARVPGWGCTLNPTVTFGGDDRSWETPTPAEPGGTGQKYRTQMFGNINWTNPAPYDFVSVKNVGATTVYTNNVLTTTVYASMSDMNFESVQVGTNYAKAYFNHTAGNPGCTFMGVAATGSIRYAEWVEFYRSGTVAVNGYRFKAPAHEMYGRLDDWSWKTISRRSNEGFHCLLGNAACALDFYNVSVS